MKFCTSIILVLASTLITASPVSLAKRASNADAVLATINQWLNDISVSLPLFTFRFPLTIQQVLTLYFNL
jgi:hypothetical protein